METERLFFGIELPPDLRRAIARTARVPGPGLALTHEENLHVTLRFLGDTAEEDLKRIVESARRVHVGPFTLALEGVGRFPARGPIRIVWIGLGSGHPNLFRLRQQVDDALLQLGLPYELRDFVPHVTVARTRPGGEGAARRLLAGLEGFTGPVFKSHSFALYASERSAQGSSYRVLERFDLRD